MKLVKQSILSLDGTTTLLNTKLTTNGLTGLAIQPSFSFGLLSQQSDQLYAMQPALLVSHAKFLIEEETIHDS